MLAGLETAALFPGTMNEQDTPMQGAFRYMNLCHHEEECQPLLFLGNAVC